MTALSNESNIDPGTGIDKDVLSTHHSEESLAAIKDLKDAGKQVDELLAEKGAMDTDLDKCFANYTESLSLYLTCHADNEFSDQQDDKFIKNHGDSLKLRANQMHKMSERFSDGKIGPDEIQFLYSIKTSMEAEDKHCSSLLSYIKHKK